MTFYEPKPLNITILSNVLKLRGRYKQIATVISKHIWGFALDDLSTYDLYGFYVAKAIKNSKFFLTTDMKIIMCDKCNRIIPL